MARRRWYLLIHQLPVKPLYLRAKIGLRLSRAGSIALKRSVYLLPRRKECLEDLRSIANEAALRGGEAYILEAGFRHGISDGQIARRFNAERAAGYKALAAEVREALANWKRRRRAGPPDVEPAGSFPRFEAKFAGMRAVDFFGAPGRKGVSRLLRSLEERRSRARTREGPGGAGRDLIGRVWVTRRGIHIDRIASAWLVRRFIDPKARFRFVDPKETEKRAGEIRFDMAGGDFTHQGDRCTFETILDRIGMREPAIDKIAEVVHDIDLKDGKYGRPEAPGIERVLLGILLANPRDEDRLERGLLLFDDLSVSFRGRSGAALLPLLEGPKRFPPAPGRLRARAPSARARPD